MDCFDFLFYHALDLPFWLMVKMSQALIYFKEKSNSALSPFLLIIMSDMLNFLIQHSVWSGRINHFAVPWFWSVYIIRFADDILIFCWTDPAQVSSLQILLKGFVTCSGLQINFFKSSIIYFGRDPDRLTDFWLSIHLSSPYVFGADSFKPNVAKFFLV